MTRSSVRADIERTIKDLNIDRAEFHEVSKLQWKEILHKTVEHFVEKNHHNQDLHWAWLRLKEPCASFLLHHDDGYRYIPDMIHEEYVWFIVEDSNDKMWVYEGKPLIIPQIIADSYYIDEYYIVSKKYEWLICENHHGIMHGSGEKIIHHMNQFKNLYPERIG